MITKLDIKKFDQGTKVLYKNNFFIRSDNSKFKIMLRNHRFDSTKKYLDHNMDSCKKCKKSEKMLISAKKRERRNFRIKFVRRYESSKIKKSKQKTKEVRSQKKIATVRKRR